MFFYNKMNYTIEEMMCNNEDTIYCCLFQPNTPLQNERLWDNNSNNILFKNNNSNGEQVVSNECIEFLSNSYNLGNNCTLVSKVNHSKKLAMVLTYKDDIDKRILIDSYLLVDGKKYNVTDFTIHNELQANVRTYINIATCNYDSESDCDSLPDLIDCNYVPEEKTQSQMTLEETMKKIEFETEAKFIEGYNMGFYQLPKLSADGKTLSVEKDTINILTKIMAEGLNKFESGVGRPASYLEMRQMMG